jgi:effector-binding domain-containing protein
MMQVVNVPESKAARFHAFSSSPEEEAWGRMMEWAQAHGFWKAGVMLEPDASARIYGYNNPNPSAGSPNYGYEFLAVGPDPDGAPDVVDFPGGRYVVVPFEGDDPHGLPEAWRALVERAEREGHETGHHQWLERHLPPGFHVHLYLPVG